MNGESDKSSPSVSSDGPDSLDALPEDLFKQDSDLCVESSCSVEAPGVEQKVISGLDVALSEDYTDQQNANSESFDSVSEDNCVQSELSAAEGQDTLLTSDLDALPDGGFDDIVAMEAEGDSQFEQTMAMLRDLSGSEACPAIVSCVDDSSLDEENAVKTETRLNSDFNDTSATDYDKNGISEDGVSSLNASTVRASEPIVDAIQTNHHAVSLADRKPKGSSGFFNRCIENLLQRGRETAARTDTGDPQNQSGVASTAAPVSTTTSTNRSSHRKSRKPTKLSHMRLSEDVVIASAKTPLPLHCTNCTYTCNSSSELTSHSAVCGVDTGLSKELSGFTCTYCKTRYSLIEDLRRHLSQHVGDHVIHCFFCRFCDYRSDSMDLMDDHITVRHPKEPSRYEVSLEKVAYLQNMMECPVCGGSFPWKSIFVQHCRSNHRLEDLAAYLESTFPESPAPKSCKVSRQLFESFADILQTDSVAEDSVSTEMAELTTELSHDGGTVKRFQCDQCSFSADNWELWDRHVQEHHGMAGDDFLRGEEDWSNGGHLVIDEDEALPDASANGFPASQSQKTLPSLPSGTLYPKRTSQEHENNLERGLKNGPDESTSMFPPGMEPELVPVNPVSGEVPQLMKIGSGRKGVKLRCRLCPFECYRTPNFRRHLAIHVHQAEYPESYRCAYCKFQHRRLNCIRFHLGKYHGQLPAKLSRVVRGKVVEIISADDMSIPAAKYGRALLDPSNNPAPPVISASHSSLSAEDYAMNRKDEMGASSNPCQELALDDQSQPGSAYSREKRLCKPPKRLSDSSDFQPPTTIINSWKIRKVPSVADGGNVPSPFARLAGQSRNAAGRPFDDNIAEDYILSDLPPGMIYPEPIKCPRCSFTNRVRINLVRHMKQHHTEDEQQMHGRTPASSASSLGPSWLENVPAWARPQVTSHTSPSTQSVVRNDPTKSLRDTAAAAGTFAGGRYLLPKPPPKLPNQLGALSGADARFTHGYLASGRLEWNGQTTGRTKDRPSSVEAKTGGVGTGQFLMGRVGGLSTRETSVKRLFKCAYCSVSSRWNRRDISLHVLHVHVRRRAFRCRRCGYGTSKSAAAVTVHCARTHPGRPAIVEDNLTVLNAILPLHTRPGTVLVAFRRPNGIPIMDLDELEEYFGLSKISTDSADEQPARDSSQTVDTVGPDDYGLQYSSTAPLDLSAQLQKDTVLGISQSVFPTPYHDVLSQDTIQRHYPGTFGSQRTRTENSDKTTPADSSTAVSSMAERSRDELTGSKDKRLDAGAHQPRARTSSNSTSSIKDTPLPSPGTAFYRCRICGYQDSRHDKTKYHVVREHLHLGPYGCAYCPRYMWGRRHVARHIAAVHPTMPVQIRRAFDEFEAYLRENIRKIGGQPNKFPTRKSTQSPLGSTTSSHTEPVPTTSGVETAVQPAGQASDSLKRKSTFQCGHCEFRDALAAKVQGHCLAKHPSKAIRYRRCDDDDDIGSEFTATGALADVKIESVESLAFGQDFFSTPDSSTSGHVTDTGSHGDVGSRRTQWTDSGGKSGAGGVGSDVMEFPPFMCRYCPESSWTEDVMRSHLVTVHSDKPAQFGVVQQCSTAMPTFGPLNGRDVTVDDEADDDDDDDEDEDAAVKYAGGVETELTNRSSSLSSSTAAAAAVTGGVMYRCRMCQYHTDKVTVMRHHVMSHLLYHPYRCPYCDAARSVKSSPINKHVRLRHPGQEPNFICERDEDMERQVRNSYYRSEANEAENSLPLQTSMSRRTVRPQAPANTTATAATAAAAALPPSSSYDQSAAADRSSRRVTKRILYRCKFCRLKTYVRTDMRHHLMREIGYKPYRCGHCYAAAGGKGSGYSEPSRSAMGKHFRLRHAGMTIDVHDLSEPARDLEVIQLLDECAIDEEQDELNTANTSLVSGGCIKRSSLRNLSGTSKPQLQRVSTTDEDDTATPPPPVLTPAVPSGPPRSRPSQSDLSELGKQQQQQQKRGKIKSMRLRRCPQCAYSSPSTKALAQHVAVRHRPHRLRCGYCGHMSHYPSWLRKHSRKSHPDLPFNFINMETSSAPVDELRQTTVNDTADAGNFPADGEEIPQDSASPLEQEELSTEEDNQIVMTDQVELMAVPSAFALTAVRVPPSTGPAPSSEVDSDLPEIQTTLTGGGSGLMRCSECDFMTVSRAQYKMHAMKHRPRTWQCGHCSVNFTLLLQLRQHSFMKHRDKSPRWIDTTTGKLHGDDSTGSASSSSALTTATAPTPTTASSESPHAVPVVRSRKPTARKSTSQSGIRVAMLRCGDFFSIRQCAAVDEGSPAASGTSTEASVDSGISQTDSTEHLSQLQVLCCHLCTFTSQSLSLFANHLQVLHQWSLSRRIEILVPDDPDTPRRCGFCQYETFSDPDFSDHVSAVHGMSPPILCSVCQKFASFGVGEIREHFVNSHPSFASAEYEPLSTPYSMCCELQLSKSTGPVARDDWYMLSPLVHVTDIADMSHVEFSNLLDCYGAWFDY